VRNSRWHGVRRYFRFLRGGCPLPRQLLLNQLQDSFLHRRADIKVDAQLARADFAYPDLIIA
jgi:hypothetical protein